MGPLLNKINSPYDVRKLDVQDLPKLAKEVREYILDIVSKNGGHLGAALGAVDLTLAVHYCFESPEDVIVWDVGHQAHAHKILTGRKEAFKTFRQHGGLSGFSNKDESPHDPFTTGHGGTSISAALGIATANRVLGKPEKKVVAVIGDASLVSGMAFEALNHAGHLKDNLIVILNDNEMSISKTVGALSRHLNKIITNPFYNHVRKDIEHFIRRMPKVGKPMVAAAKRIDEGLKNLLVPGLVFEELGFRYFGPLDGHNINELVKILKNISKINGPILLHIVTKKGKGYDVAEKDPTRWHASTPFCVETGVVNKTSSVKTYTQVFGEAMNRIAEKNKKVVAITAAMCEGTGLVEFSKKFEDRFFDVGIAEEHGVTFAAGLAKQGIRPFVAIYSTFLQRSHDQIIHDVALQNLPVVFCLDRAGLVGEDGPTHHGVFDICFLRKIPTLTVMAPKDGREFELMLKFAEGFTSGPLAIRYPRGAVAEESNSPLKNNAPEAIALGKSEILQKGREVALVAYGSMVYVAYEAAQLLKKSGVEATVVNARFAKPLDEKTLLGLTQEHAHIFTIEEGALAGGFGSAVMELLPQVKRLGIPDAFISHGKREILLDDLGLSAKKIHDTALESLNSTKNPWPKSSAMEILH